MANVLNLALKKDVFEGLQNGDTNEVVINGTRWWKKRLMDLDTGRFKDFDVACISSGSSDKVEYPILKIEQRDCDFVVIVNNLIGTLASVDNGDSDSDETIQETTVNPLSVEMDENGELVPKKTEFEDEMVHDDEGEEEVVEEEEAPADSEFEPGEEIVDTEPDEKYNDLAPVDNSKIISATTNILNRFCELRDVYVVNMPKVTIRNNGQVFGCKKRLVADRESDVMFEFTKKEIVKTPMTTNTVFLATVLTYLTNLMKNNYVFINRQASGFKEGTNGNVVFVVTAVAKKKYFFTKK